MQSNHARIKRSSGSSSRERRRRERTGKADRTELTLTDHLLLNSSCEPPGPSFHAFHCGAPTPQVRDPGTPSQCGSGRSYSLRICTRFWLNARTHAHSRAQNTRTYTLTAAAADGREVWLCWQRGPPPSSPSSRLLVVLHQWDISGTYSATRNSIDALLFFRRFLPLSLPPSPDCHIHGLSNQLCKLHMFCTLHES